MVAERFSVTTREKRLKELDKAPRVLAKRRRAANDNIANEIALNGGLRETIRARVRAEIDRIVAMEISRRAAWRGGTWLSEARRG